MVHLEPIDGHGWRRMEWVKPIDEVEADFRRQGAFLLVDATGRKVWFFKSGGDAVTMNRMTSSLKGRTQEMANFLIARAKGETK